MDKVAFDVATSLENLMLKSLFSHRQSSDLGCRSPFTK